MNVRELIELLRMEDPDREVHVAQDRHDYVGHTDAHKVKAAEIVRCRIDMLGYNAPTVVDEEDADPEDTYVNLFTIFG